MGKISFSRLTHICLPSVTGQKTITAARRAPHARHRRRKFNLFEGTGQHVHRSYVSKPKLKGEQRDFIDEHQNPLSDPEHEQVSRPERDQRLSQQPT